MNWAGDDDGEVEEVPSPYWTADLMADWLLDKGKGALVELFTDGWWWYACVCELQDTATYLQVKISYIGGVEDEDEWVCVSSQRLRPFTLMSQ